MSSVKAGIGALKKPAVVTRAPIMGKLPTVVPVVAFARPPAGAFDGVSKIWGFPTGAFHGCQVELVGHVELLSCDGQGEAG